MANKEFKFQLFDICISIIVGSVAIGASVSVAAFVVWFIHSLINGLF